MRDQTVSLAPPGKCFVVTATPSAVTPLFLPWIPGSDAPSPRRPIPDLAERTVRTLPSRIGHNIRHLHISFSQTAGIPLTADTIRKFIDQFQSCAFDCCRDPSVPFTRLQIRPPRHSFRRQLPRFSFAEFDATLTGTQCGHLFRHRLQLVEPISHIFRSRIGAQDQMSGKPLF